jgi:hypothetical protein
MLSPVLRFGSKRRGGGIDPQQKLVVLRGLLQMRAGALGGRELLVAHIAAGQKNGGRVEAASQIIPGRLSVQSRATQEQRKTETQHDVLPIFSWDHESAGRGTSRPSREWPQCEASETIWNGGAPNRRAVNNLATAQFPSEADRMIGLKRCPVPRLKLPVGAWQAERNTLLNIAQCLARNASTGSRR